MCIQCTRMELLVLVGTERGMAPELSWLKVNGKSAHWCLLESDHIAALLQTNKLNSTTLFTLINTCLTSAYAH